MTWTLENALYLIREIQPNIKKCSYHVCLGGGVLNKGKSDKDLDLYFSPFSDTATANSSGLLEFLTMVLGDRHSLGGPSVQPQDEFKAYPAQTRTFPHGRFTYWPDGKRVDVFIA